MKPILRHLTFLTAIAIACLHGAPASAQLLDLSPQTSPVVNTPAAFPTIAAMSYYTHKLDKTHHALGARLNASSADVTAPPDASALRRLDFAPSGAVTQEVEQQMIQVMSPGMTANEQNDLKKLLQSGVLRQTFAELLGKFGYSPHNIADVMTAYIVLSWETAHDADATKFPRGIQTVHERLRRALATNPQVATLTDANKQGFSEVLATQAMLNTIARKQLIKRGDTARLRQLEHRVNQETMKLGVDVASLQLTDKGFIKR